MSEAEGQTISQSELAFEVSDTELESWDAEPEEVQNEEDSEDIDGVSEEASSDTPLEDPVEDFEDISEENAEPIEEDKAEDDGQGSEDLQEAEEVEGTGESKEPETLKVKVDGEEVDVSLDDLKSNYSGKVAYDKKFSELDRDKKAYETEVAEVNGYINTFAEKLRSGDGMGAMSYFAEFNGMPPHEFKQQLIQSLLPEIEKYQGMDPRDIDLEYKQQEADYYKRQNESVQAQTQEREAATALQTVEQNVQDKHGFDSDDWLDASAHIKAHITSDMEYSPELVRDFMIAERAEGILTEVDASLLDDATFYETLQTIIKNDNGEDGFYTNDDLKELVSNARKTFVEEPKVKAVEEKLAKTATKKTKKPQTTKNKNQEFSPIMDDSGYEVEDFDDIL